MNQLDRIWSAKWIENTECPPDAAPLFKKTFTMPDSFEKAELFISGVGFYVARINGQRVGDALLAPAFSAYDKTVYYNAYDVSDLLTSGENRIEVILGNGWFNEQLPDDWQFHNAPWKNKPQLICELTADGRTCLVSDASWVCGLTRIAYNSLRFGETYDASIEEPTESYPARVSRGAGGLLKLQRIQPIRLQEIIDPAAVLAVPDGSVTYDFGVNLAGNAEIRVKGAHGGKVRIVYAECLNPDNSIERSGIRASTQLADRFQEDEYILSGNGEEIWHSEFGYNGFRYAQVFCENAELISIQARCFHTDLPSAGFFETDHPLMAQLQNALLRSTRTNFHHIPTDCPHREKNGWTGDAQLSCEQALFNFDMKAAYIKWMDDLIDSQRPNGEIPGIVPTCIWGYNWGNGPTWDLALFEIPWRTYVYTGDREILERTFDAMQRYISFLEFTDDDGVWKNALGDWCAPDGAPSFPRPIIVTAYAMRAIELFKKTARVLDRTAEAEHAEQLYRKSRETFISRFVGCCEDTQTYLCLLLAFSLSDEPKEELIARLERTIIAADYHMMCGIFGVKLIYNVLTDNGRFDLAWKLLNAEGYPGWSDMLSRCPSTLSETWSNDASLNHHMYSSIGDWFYKGVAGIHLDEENPGFRHVFLCPHVPEGVGFFRAGHETPMGLLTVEWKNGKLTVTLPEGAAATLSWNGETKRLTAGVHTF